MDRATFESLHDLERRPRQVSPINVECSCDAELEAIQEHPAVHLEVKHCARLTQASRAARLSGNITAALRLEAKLQRAYETLPKALRW